MAIQEHKDKLYAGADVWNKWREDNTDIIPDLSSDTTVKPGAADVVEVDRSGQVLSRINFRGADLKGANFRGAKLAGADVTDADLRFVNLEEANVADIKYGYTAKWRKIWVAPHKPKYMGIRVASCYGAPGFKRYAQDQEYIEMIQASRPWLYRLWNISSDCGRSLSRWMLWSLFFAVLFASFFAWLGEGRFYHKLQFNGFTEIYYSIVTFTTLGFGDITPKTAVAAFIVMIEVVVGYVMLGGLISIFATKLARRAG